MKKIKILLSTLIGIFIVLTSCSNDDDKNSTTTKKLILITKDYYTNNSLTFSSKFNFYNDKLINIQYSDNSYDDIYYEGNLISRILEFGANDDLVWTTTYNYNSFNQLTKKKVIPSPNNTNTNVSRQKDFVYNGNIIQSENFWSDGGFHKNTIHLNSENFIIEDEMFSIDNELVNRRLFEYLNNNLSKQTIKDSEDNIIYEETHNYLDKIRSKEHRYSEYLFGNQWKNNSSINKQFGLGQFTPYEISENYISDYYTYSFVLDVSVTGTFSYEFDSNDFIIKQTENINQSTGGNYKIITTYEYE